MKFLLFPDHYYAKYKNVTNKYKFDYYEAEKKLK